MKDTHRLDRPETTPRAGRFDRRTFLKTGAILAGGTFGTGTARTRSKSSSGQNVHEGESIDVGDGTVRTSATTNSSGELSSLDVHVDGDALSSVDTDEEEPHESVGSHLSFPDEVDTHQFTFMGFHFEPVGHPPPDVYTVPHFDFHFYMMEEAAVEAIPFGIATYDVPDEQFPSGYMFGEPRLLEPEMGEHLLDETAPEFEDDGEFTHTYVYGTYDPSIDPENPTRIEELELEGEVQEVPVFEGDGESRLHFVEPMVTTEFLADLEEEISTDVGMPEAFHAEDRYPTKYTLTPNDSGVTVSIGDFEEFPGAGE